MRSPMGIERKLSVHRSVVAVDPLERGRLLNAAEVAQLVFDGKVSKKWIFERVPSHFRHKVGRLVLYYEGEVRAWVATLRQVA
jgi:predicted DNA-binding transcriptional regulator AlpA